MPNLLTRISKKNQSRDDKTKNSRFDLNQKLNHPLQLAIGSAQSVGLQRDHNEDALFTFSSVLSDGNSEELFGLFIIADGMGGHKNGEIASSISIRVVVRYVIDQLYRILLDVQNGTPALGTREILLGAVNEAQKAVLHHASGGGTTLTIALLLGDQLTISHVGDSRAYLVNRDGSLHKITRDHSLVQRLLDLNEITPEEAEKHPQKNILIKAVGQPEPFQPDTFNLQIPAGAGLMLCSDGLWGVVSEKIISKTLTSFVDPIIACQKLVDEANNAGGPDNISVIIVKTANNFEDSPADK